MIPVPRIDAARRPLAWLLCVALAACVNAPAPPPASEPLFVDESFTPPSEHVSAVDVFEVSPEMRAWLEMRAAAVADNRSEARGLVEALFKDQRVQIDYDAQYTRTAAQAFHARQGNCLSLAIVTGAMAKELGLEVVYQSVDTSEHWEREGDLLELVGHVNVTVGVPIPKIRAWVVNTDRWTVDFMPSADLRNVVTAPISEARVTAMFMNNRAAESLAAKRVDDAYWWVRSGVAADPSFYNLYNTLGVTYLHKGLLRQAETAFRFALSKMPRRTETWINLAVVLRREGRTEEAALIEREHPLTGGAALAANVEAGMKANAAGDYDRALQLFTRALRSAGDNHQLHYQLAVTYLNLGDRRRAMEQLRLAQDDSTTARQRSIYSSKIELLKSTTSSFRLDPNAVQAN